MPQNAQLVRVGRRGRNWDLPRRFEGFSIADPAELTIQGAAPKVILRKPHENGEIRYIAKRAEKFGEIETYTEFFSNQLGRKLGFKMAHSGLMRIGGELHFVSKSFLKSEERLVHGSVLIAEAFGEEKDMEEIKGPGEQKFYSIEFVLSVLNTMCGDTAGQVISNFIEMLTFDSLIGSMDRHAQNWGVIGEHRPPLNYKFAPIFDTARALLWDYSEEKIGTLLTKEHQLKGYTQRSRPCIGIERHDSVNHFELITHLLLQYRNQTLNALAKIDIDKVKKGIRILEEFPFDRAFSKLRRTGIVRILTERAAILGEIAEASLHA